MPNITQSIVSVTKQPVSLNLYEKNKTVATIRLLSTKKRAVRSIMHIGKITRKHSVIV